MEIIKSLFTLPNLNVDVKILQTWYEHRLEQAGFPKTNEYKNRWYGDYVLMLKNVDYHNKLILGIGERDSFLGAYLSSFSKVWITDNFEQIFWWEKEDPRFKREYWENYWLKIAEKPENIIIQHQDAMDIIAADEFYDIVYSICVFEHIDNWLRALKESYRVLKPGGVCYLTIDCWKTGLELPHSNIINYYEFIDRAREIGFTVHLQDTLVDIVDVYSKINLIIDEETGKPLKAKFPYCIGRFFLYKG
jgi:SAM-dependent methyltransferase